MSNLGIIENNEIKSLVNDTLNKCDDGELFLEEKYSENFMFDDNVLKVASYNETNGFGFRAVKEEVVGYSHSSTVDYKSIKEAARTISAVKKGYKGEKIIEPALNNTKLYTDTNPIAEEAFSNKVNLLKDINDYGRSLDNKVRQMSVSLSGIYQKVNILRPSGLIISDIRPLVRLNISITLDINGKKEVVEDTRLVQIAQIGQVVHPDQDVGVA